MLGYTSLDTLSTDNHTPVQYDGGLAIDKSGNLYIADLSNNRVRKVASNGVITTVAGNGSATPSGDGGPAISAGVVRPYGVAVDAAGNLFITTSANRQWVRKVDTSGIITTYSDQIAFGIAVDAAGNLYVADFTTVVKIAPDGSRKIVAGSAFVPPVSRTGFGQNFAGDGGPATSAGLAAALDIAINESGDLYICDTSNERIRRVDRDGIINTIAGNGAPNYSGDGVPAVAAGLSGPNSIGTDVKGNLYIVDAHNGKVRRVDVQGRISTIADYAQRPVVDGAVTNLLYPEVLGVDAGGNVFVGGRTSATIHKITPDGAITKFAGTGERGYSGDGGPATRATIVVANGIVVDAAGNVFFIDGSRKVRKIDTRGTITSIAGTGECCSSGDGGRAIDAKFTVLTGIAVDGAGNVFVSDQSPGVDPLLPGRIRRIDPNGGINSVPGTLNTYPTGIALDGAGNLYISDSGRHSRILKVTPGGSTTTYAGNDGYGFAGDGGAATNASLFGPTGLWVDAAGDLYIADTFNNRVRKVLLAKPGFRVSPATLAFVLSAGSRDADAQTLQLSSAAALEFSASVDAAWIKVSPAAGGMPAAIDVSVDATNLKPGAYSGTITITAPLATPPVQQVRVSATVAPKRSARIAVATGALTFAFVQGAAAASRTVTISNQSVDPADFTATISGANGAKVEPGQGQVTAAQPATITVTADPGSLASGTYSSALVVSSSSTGQTFTIPLTVTISAVQRKILLSQTGLSFVAAAGRSKPLAQSFGILNVGRGTMNWTAEALDTRGGPIRWFSVAPKAGSVARPYLDASLVDVAVDTSAMTPGDYYGQIRVRADDADNSPQFVTVLLSIKPEGTPIPPEVRPTGLIFTGGAGSSPGAQEIDIGNPGGKPTSYNSNALTLDGGKWLTYVPANASIAADRSGRIAVQPDFSSLAPGTIYKGAVNLLFDDFSTTQSRLRMRPRAPRRTTAWMQAAVHGTFKCSTRAPSRASQPVPVAP